EGDLDHHAEVHWPLLGGVEVRWRGGYGYVIGFLDDEQDEDADEESVRLCRIGYTGSPEDWAFALYDPAPDSYPDTVPPHGSFTRPVKDILDCACRVHLADIPNQPTQP